jgi:hypothetical protein
MGVAAIDDPLPSSAFWPRFTIVEQPGYEMGKAAVELLTARLPVLGVPIASGRRAERPADEPAGMLERVGQRIAQAWRDLFSYRRVDPATTRLLTTEEESLRRQHLELLLFAARIAAMQEDEAAYRQSLQAADAWLEQFFDGSEPEVAAARSEIGALGGLDIDPARPEVGAAAQLLQRVIRAGSPQS